jgi:tetratricopeptide (TPR) repeat protein
MLDGREQDPSVRDFLAKAAADESPLVRVAAIRALAGAKPDVLSKATSDPSRNVRLSASWQLLMNRQSLPSGPREEIEKYLRNASDQVGGAFFQARLAAVENRLPEMERWTGIATTRDPSSGMFDQAAHLMYQANLLPKAKDYFDKALAADPDNADAAYSLALLEAELGNSARSRQLLRKTVTIEPDFGRAWYNLGLAEAAAGDLPASAAALDKAASLLPNSPDPAYALATVQLRMNSPAKAAESAKRALAIAPGHPQARSLLRQLNISQTPEDSPASKR